MSQHGATLQGLNNEMVSCVETLRRKREETHEQILKEQVSVGERGKRERERARGVLYTVAVHTFSYGLSQCFICTLKKQKRKKRYAMFKGDYESKDCPALSNTLTGSGREFSFGHFEDIRRPPRCRKFINADPYLIILYASMLLSCTLQAEKLKLWVLLLNEWWVSVKYAKLKKESKTKPMCFKTLNVLHALSITTQPPQHPQRAPCSIYHNSTSTAHAEAVVHKHTRASCCVAYNFVPPRPHPSHLKS